MGSWISFDGDIFPKVENRMPSSSQIRWNVFKSLTHAIPLVVVVKYYQPIVLPWAISPSSVRIKARQRNILRAAWRKLVTVFKFSIFDTASNKCQKIEMV